jgi:hypothetical protein
VGWYHREWDMIHNTTGTGARESCFFAGPYSAKNLLVFVFIFYRFSIIAFRVPYIYACFKIIFNLPY